MANFFFGIVKAISRCLRLFAVCLKTATGILSLDDKHLRNLLIQEAQQNSQATHVVVGVNWGRG